MHETLQFDYKRTTMAAGWNEPEDQDSGEELESKRASHMLAQCTHKTYLRVIATTVAVLLLAASCERAAPSASPLPPTPTPTASKQLGDTCTRPADGATMVYVPAGEFQMGSTYEQSKVALALCKAYTGGTSICLASSFDDEKPAHMVALDGFWIDRTEVTNGQYQRCVRSGDCLPPVETASYTRESYYGNPAYDDYPVVWVTQAQAADFCTWAGARLPTEAEWEYAARGPEGRLFPWGDEFDGTRLNYCDASCATGVKDQTLDDGYPETAPVGSFPSGISWCGALDMAGNVREWVADWFGYYSRERQVNPTGPPSGDSHPPRGGCWLDTPDSTRCANRGENTIDYTRHKVGFRCAANADAVSP